MRVVHVCSAHRTDDARVFHRECVSLAQAGYDVHLIATTNGADIPTVKGITLHPMTQTVSRKERFSRRSEVAKKAALLNADLFHVHEPELLAAVLKVAGKKPVIYDVHETYLDAILERAWIPKPLRSAVAVGFNHVEGSLVRRCAAIIVATDYLTPRYLEFKKKTVTLANYPRLSEFENLIPGAREAGSCVFIGSIGRSRGVAEAIQAILKLNDSGTRVTFDLGGWFGGEHDFESEVLATASKDGPIRYHGSLNRLDALQLANRNSIGLVPHWRTTKMEKAWPVKMMEYMALGLPVIYSGLASHIELARGREIGICIDDPRDSDSIADAIQFLAVNPVAARAMGAAGREVVEQSLNWEKESLKLVELYKCIQVS